jgi:hypothetical protein
MAPLPYNPDAPRLTASPSVWARPVSLATTPGVSLVCARLTARPHQGRSLARASARLLIPLPRGTKMFQFPRFPPCPPRRVSSHHGRGVAPFGFGWLFARVQLPIHVSPLSAPFIGSWPLGIHRLPFSAWLHSLIEGSERTPIGTKDCIFYFAIRQNFPRSVYSAIANLRFGKIDTINHHIRLEKC